METQVRVLDGIRRATLLTVGVLALGATGPSFADGTDELGPPSIGIADGSGFVASGVGLSAMGDGQPGIIDITVPDGATVQQVLLYWDGAIRGDFGATDPQLGVTTDIVQVNGFDVEGVFIGGRQFSNGGAQQLAFRADITGLGLVGPGVNALSVSGLDFGLETGAGALVIIDEGETSTLGIFDGSDYAYIFCSEDPECSTTVPQTFSFPAADEARMADLNMFFASVRGTASGGEFRPSALRVTVGNTQPIVFNNLLDSVDGQEWDTVRLGVEIPAGVTAVTVQAFSEDNLGIGGQPASFKWLLATLSVPEPRLGGQGCTPGYWRQPHHFADWTAPYDPTDLFSSVFEDAFPGWTLLDVVRARGGGINALGRHTVAALLNSASGEVEYDLSPQEVIDAFNAVYPDGPFNPLKNRFEAFNEQGCPLNNSDGSNFRSSDSTSGPVAATSAGGAKKGKAKGKGKKKGKWKGKGKKKGLNK